MHYIRFLAEAHRQIKPKLYTEIGVRHGRSLAVARTRSYGIDPGFQIMVEIDADVRLFRTTSDEFFQRPDIPTLFEQPTEMAFIDGMHLFEYALRDFINVERTCRRHSIVFFDDVFPRVPEEAVRDQRQKATNAWTGDVWKIVPCLQEYRPDLTLVLIDTQPTGLLMACSLNPEEQTLQANYDEIVEKFSAEMFSSPPPEVMARKDSIPPRELIRSGLMQSVASARADFDLKQAVEDLRQAENVK